MNKQDELEILIRDFGLKSIDVQFLDLIPLIEVMWADGKNQDPELNLLYRFTIEHIARLDRSAGIHAVSVADANDFLDRFAHRRPPPELLEQLRNFVFDWDEDRSDQDAVRHRHGTMLDYCMDIAAACVPHYPYGVHDRIIREEKRFLKELIQRLLLTPDECQDTLKPERQNRG
jgi:hypothetical protein